MRKDHVQSCLLILLTASLAAAGCSKTSASAPAALAPAKVPATVSHAFDKSSGATERMAANYVSAFQGQDPAKAFVELQKLSARNDLTPQQRSVTARAMMTTMQQLRAAADQGNAAARSVLHHYIASR